MKALILAGGYATRLRPLSFAKPKLLFPIMGKPILERTFNTLAKIGVDNVVLAVNHMADELKHHFGARYKRIRIQYSYESKPLGTGGPIKLAQQLLGSRSSFLAMNGDVLFEGDLSKMLSQHKKKKPVATIALHAAADVRRFGLINIDDEMRVSSFLEKPSGEGPISGLINAGIYLLSPEIFEYIRLGRKTSIEREVFPILAKEGKLLGHKLDGYWTDMGTIDDYLETNFTFLKAESHDKPLIEKTAKISDTAVLKPPCLILKNGVVKDNAVIGPLAVVGRGSVVEEAARIERSILFDGVHIGRSSMISGTVVGDGSHVSDCVRLGDGTVLAAGTSVRSGVKLEGGVKVCPYKEICEDITGPANIL
jgi:NDP-sugar pyrophosphorylase family protein